MKTSLLITTLLISLHSFYFSLTKVHHNKETAALEITMKIFTDDLEHALNKHSGQKTRLGTRREADSTDYFLETYLADKVRYSLDSIPHQPQFIGKEVLFDLTYVYLEIPQVDSLSSLGITSSLLTEVSPKQVNEFRFDSDSFKESVQLSQAERQKTILLKHGNN